MYFKTTVELRKPNALFVYKTKKYQFDERTDGIEEFYFYVMVFWDFGVFVEILVF